MKTFRFKTYTILCCFILMVAFTSCSKDDILEEDIELSETLSMAEEILQLVNAHRISIGKQALSFNKLANDLAYEHTRYMIAQNDISHDDFDNRSD